MLEDGKPQAIEQFRLVRVDGNPRPGDPPPRELRNRIDEEIEISTDDVRLFVFFFDDYHVRLGNSLAVKEPLIRFVQTQLRPNDIVGIMYPLTPLDGISFTRNHGVGRQRDRAVRGAQVRLPAAQRVRGAVRASAVRSGRADSQPGRHDARSEACRRGSAGCAKDARPSSTSAKG